MNIKKENAEIKDTKEILNVPFYGVRGSIKNIKEEENYYIVTRYNTNGKDGEILSTSKKYKKDLMKNYHDDVKKYLETNDEKFLTTKNNLSKKTFNKIDLALGTTISLSLAITSILGTIYTSGATSYAFMTTFFFTFIASCHEINQVKKYREEITNKKFIEEYKNYQEQINNYNISRDKQNKLNQTNYKGLTNKEDKNKIIDIDIKKILKKKGA